MFFLNLSAPEFLTLLGTLGGLVTALYLFDRTKRKRVVSTLRFWTSAGAAEDQPRRTKVNQPWSLVLQLLSLLCLLLAIAQLNWGTREFRSRDHVLLVDTSAWAGATDKSGKIIDREREAARSYLAVLRPDDRVLLVATDALSTPVAAFTSDRVKLRSALAGLKEGFSGLNIAGALAYARQAQDWSGGRPGEIVYIGPGRIDVETAPGSLPSNLRTIKIPSDVQNCGIRSISVRRSEDDASSWQATVTLTNDGRTARNLELNTQYAGTKFASRRYALKPGAEIEARYDFVTNTAGLFRAEIGPHDALPVDDTASLQLPNNGSLKVAAYTRRKDLLSPLLAADHRLNVEYFDPAQYVNEPKADVVILDGFSPRNIPSRPTLLINPPKQSAPVPVKAVVNNATITQWKSGIDLGSGLHTREDRLPSAEVFQPDAGDVAFASVAAGPTIVLRPRASAGAKLAVIGFDPLQPELRFTLTTPLVFANLLSWLSPESFRTPEFTAKRVGAASVPLREGESRNGLQVTDAKGLAIPFTLAENTVQLFTREPDVIRIVSEDRERVLSLTLPDVPRGRWDARQVPDGLPAPATYLATSTDLWKFLACLGGLGLLAEWYLFGGGRRVSVFRTPASRRGTRASVENQAERTADLVSR
jgi:Aerotolerance regulator N-terminal/von Willebrand factor type A domain